MKRLLALFLCLAVLLASDCVPALASVNGGPENTCYALREEDVWRYYPAAIITCPEWKALLDACNYVDELATSIINVDEYSAAVLSFFKNAVEIAKASTWNLLGRKSEDYSAVTTRKATEEYYRKLIQAKNLDSLADIKEVNKTFSTAYSLVKSGQKLARGNLEKLCDNGVLREYLGDDAHISTFRYLCGLDYADVVKNANKGLSIASYGLDNMEYALTYAQMVTTDMTLMYTLQKALLPNDELHANLESYRDYLSTGFVELYLKDMVVDKYLFDAVSGFLKKMVFSSPVGILPNIERFLLEKLSKFVLDRASENKASAEDVYKLALYMQYSCCLRVALTYRINDIAERGYSPTDEEKSRLLLMCFFESMQISLDVCEGIRNKGMSAKERAMYEKARNSLDAVSYEKLIASACKYASGLYNEGLLTLDHSPYPADLPSLSGGSLGRALHQVMEEYPPNDVLGIRGGDRILVSRYLYTATGNMMPPDSADEASAGSTLDPYALVGSMEDAYYDRRQHFWLRAPQMNSLKECELNVGDSAGALTALMNALPSAQCGDVLSVCGKDGAYTSIIVDISFDSVTLYDGGSPLRDMVYCPDESVGLYTVNFTDLAEWLTTKHINRNGITLGQTNGFAIYRIKEELIAPRWTPTPESSVVTPETSDVSDNPLLGFWICRVNEDSLALPSIAAIPTAATTAAPVPEDSEIAQVAQLLAGIYDSISADFQSLEVQSDGTFTLLQEDGCLISGRVTSVEQFEISQSGRAALFSATGQVDGYEEVTLTNVDTVGQASLDILMRSIGAEWWSVYCYSFNLLEKK